LYNDIRFRLLPLEFEALADALLSDRKLAIIASLERKKI
jgi:hypothetical protein